MSTSPPLTAEALLEHAEWVHRLARALVRDDAEADDLAQEVLGAALARPPEPTVSLGAWLAGATRKLARMRWRGESRRRSRDEAAPVFTEVLTPEVLVERAEAHQSVTRHLLALDEPLRGTLLLHYYEGLTSAEIARRLDVPAATVRWRLQRALADLRARLDAAEPGSPSRWALLLAPLPTTPNLIATGVLLMKGTKLAVALLLALALAWVGVTHFAKPRAPDASPTAVAGRRKHAVELRGSQGMKEATQAREHDQLGDLRLEGQVIDEHELPIAGAEIVIDSSPPQHKTSEADGGFVFENLIARAYHLEARTPEGHVGPAETMLSAKSEPVILRMRRGGTLEVGVRDAATGEPVRGANVELRSGLVWQALTDEHGQAQLSGVGAGWPTLHVAAAGYGPSALLLRTSGDPARSQRQVIALSRGAAASGRVLDKLGHPVVGARVVAVATAEPFPVIDDVRDAVLTAADGTFQVTALAAGSYRFLAAHADFAPGSTSPIALDGVHERADIALTLAAGATVRGRVVDEGGRPVAAAAVSLLGRGSVSWRLARMSYTDGNGAFQMRGLPARAVDIAATIADGSSAVQSLELTGTSELEVTLTISIRGTIAGVVVSEAGREVPEARVLLEPERTGALETTDAWTVLGISSVVADGGGHFHFAGVPPGAYRVRATRPGATDEALWSAKAALAAVGDRELRIIALADARVRGRVVYKGGGSPELFSIEIASARPEPFASTDGSFELDAAGGVQTVVVTGSSFQRATVEKVDLRGGETKDVGTITVEKGRSVSGRVLDPSGQPVTGATVAGGLLLTGDGSKLNIASEGFRVQETESDAGGRFVLRGFGEHPIVLVAQKDGIGRSISVRLPRGSSSIELDLALQRTGSIGGTLTKDGRPLPETVVIANPRGAMSSNFFVLTGADGGYTFDMLAAGDYVVAPMMGGGGMNPKDMLYASVSVTPGQRSRIDFEARAGTGTLDVKVLSDQGAPVGLAQVLIVGGTANAANMESLMEGAWLPAATGEQIVPVYFRMAVGAPAHVENLVPGSYTACATILPVDPNDTVAMRALRESASTLPMQCGTIAIAESGKQSLELRSPAPAKK